MVQHQYHVSITRWQYAWFYNVQHSHTLGVASQPYMVEQATMVVLVKICGHVLVSFELAQSLGGYLTE